LTSLAIACAVLLVVVGPASFFVASVAEGAFSWRAATIAASAGVVCYVAAASSLVVIFVCNQLGRPVPGMLLGMLFRMGLPLAAILALGNQRTLGATIIVVYLLALVVETFLAARMTPANSVASNETIAMTTTPQPRPSAAS